MAAWNKNSPQLLNKYKVSRRGRKLQISDDPRTLFALPKDIPERTWAEILQKEENELICFEIREEILEEALHFCYERYMEKQTTLFTVHCAAQAWLKLIDWNFYRHDPGEDPTAYPPCFIPKRKESWIPDKLPEPSPKDNWARHDLQVISECPDLNQPIPRTPSSCSLTIQDVEQVPKQYWFPGKVQLKLPVEEHLKVDSDAVRLGEAIYDKYSTSGSSSKIGTESEVLQKITDYEDEQLIKMQDSKQSSLKQTTPVEGSLRGAGDSTANVEKIPKKRRTDKSKSAFWSRHSMGKSRAVLPPLLGDSLSRISAISDCRLRDLRLETQVEVTDERVDSPTLKLKKK